MPDLHSITAECESLLVQLASTTLPLAEPEQIMGTTARMLVEYLKVDRCIFLLFEPDEKTFDVVLDFTQSGLPKMVGRHALGMFGPDFEEGIRKDSRVIEEDIENNPRATAALPFYRQAGVRSLVTVTLKKTGAVMSGVAVHHGDPRRWCAEEVNLVQAIAVRSWEPIERERLRREQASSHVQKQWHTFDTVLSHTPDFLYALDLRGRFTYANRALLSLWQIPLSQALGKNFFELGYPEDLAVRLQRQIQQVIETRQTVRDDTPFTGPSGETRYYEYILAPVMADKNRVEAVAGSTRDITERRRAGDREREHEEHLRETARLESLGIMAGGIAHDFNNLLTGILANASLLREGEGERERAISNEIILAAERAADLTGAMLAFSGKGSFRAEILDLNALVRENLTLLRASLSRSVSVHLELGSEPCWVEGDRAHMQQVIMNLLINASEALGDHTGEVGIRTAMLNLEEARVSERLQTVLAAGRYVLFEVRDNGSGMTPGTIKKIFDPFFTTKFTGRGLGLAATLGIIKSHKGDIEVESTFGSGTVFRVFLPESACPPSPKRRPRQGAMPNGSGRTVLVVDDEATVRRVASAALERAGFHVVVASNGLEGLDALRNNPAISIVILDLTMPVMNGEEALPLIKATRPELPIVLSSGYTEAEITTRFASAGIADFLQKPYGASALIGKVAQVLVMR